MDIHERLKILRTSIGLTTRSFGSSINITGGAVTNMEKGRREITERTIKDICREHGVNREWLVSGNGPMLEDALEGLVISDEVKALADSYSYLNNDDKELIRDLIKSLSQKSILS